VPSFPPPAGDMDFPRSMVEAGVVSGTEVLPASPGPGVARLLVEGETDLRLGARDPELDFLSSPPSELWTLPALEGGRLSSDFLLNTFVSYGLNARPPFPRAGSAGLARDTGVLSALWPAAVGGVTAELSLTTGGFFGFSNGGISGLVLGVSAPI